MKKAWRCEREGRVVELQVIPLVEAIGSLTLDVEDEGTERQVCTKAGEILNARLRTLLCTYRERCFTLLIILHNKLLNSKSFMKQARVKTKRF